MVVIGPGVSSCAARRRGIGVSACLAALGLLLDSSDLHAQSPQPVLQRGYDAGVSGAILTETTLNTSNVTPQTFGLVFTLPVDDAIFAQPLYVPNLVIPGQGTHNVLYVATMSDTLYAFDADSAGAPLWSVNFADLVGATAVPIAQFAFAGDRNITGNLGILSTPVIDPSTNVLYLVACTLENNTLAYRLHAVDITTGSEPYGPGVLLSGSFGGVTFDARYLYQRVALALSGNQVVFGFSALQDEAPGAYSGWVLAYDKGTLQQTGAFATVTTGNKGAGVWQSGRPAAVDSNGYVYLFTGNGWGGGYDGVSDFSETVLKFDPANGLALLDWFTPDNWSQLDTDDLDLSGSGPLLIPGTSLLAGGGKSGDLYLLDTTNLGKYNATNSQIPQDVNITNYNQILGGPVFWQRSAANGGSLLYNWGDKDTLKAYAFDGSQFGTSPAMQVGSAQQFPGGILTLSANGDQPASGVLWATVVTSGDADQNPPAPGAIHAYNASNLSQELWNSTMNGSDGFGNFAKYVPPMVVNGRVYVATWSNQVAVYGLRTSYTASPTSLAFPDVQTGASSAPMTVTVTNTGTGALAIPSITLSTPSPHPFSQTNNCGTSLAVNASCTISVTFAPALPGATSATLSINAGGGAGTQAVSLSGTGVGAPSFQTMLNASASSVTAGTPVTLTWSSTAGATCTPSGGGAGDGWSGTLAASGSKAVSETAAGNYSYALKCSALGVSSSATVAVAVSVPSVTLSATAASITVGQPVTLNWSSQNATACVASGGESGDGWSGSKPTQGNTNVTPQSAGTISYTLTCSSGPQSAKATATVNVASAASTSSSKGGGGALDGLSLWALVSLLGLHTLRRRSR